MFANNPPARKSRHWCPTCGAEVHRTGKRGAPQIYCKAPAGKRKSDCERFAFFLNQARKHADAIREAAPSATRGKAIHRMRAALRDVANEIDGVAR